MTYADPQTANPIASYPNSTIALHWVVAALILIVGGLGLAFGSAPRSIVLDFGVLSERSVFHPAQTIHVWLAYGLFASITVHVVATFWHQFFLRDHLVGRMLFQPRSSARMNEDTGSERSSHVSQA